MRSLLPLLLPLGIGACNPEPALVDATAAQPTLTITGTATLRDDNGAVTPAAGATLAAMRNNSTMPVATATTDASGAYALAVTTGGAAIDYVAATLDPAIPLHLYLAAPILGDVTVNPELIGGTALATLVQDACSTSLEPRLAVRIAATDALVSSQPAASRYCDIDGTTYVFGVIGVVTISVTSGSSLLGSRTVDAQLGALTVVQL